MFTFGLHCCVVQSGRSLGMGGTSCVVQSGRSLGMGPVVLYSRGGAWEWEGPVVLYSRGGAWEWDQLCCTVGEEPGNGRDQLCCTVGEEPGNGTSCVVQSGRSLGMGPVVLYSRGGAWEWEGPVVLYSRGGAWEWEGPVVLYTVASSSFPGHCLRTLGRNCLGHKIVYHSIVSSDDIASVLTHMSSLEPMLHEREEVNPLFT